MLHEDHSCLCPAAGIILCKCWYKHALELRLKHLFLGIVIAIGKTVERQEVYESKYLVNFLKSWLDLASTLLGSGLKKPALIMLSESCDLTKRHSALINFKPDFLMFISTTSRHLLWKQNLPMGMRNMVSFWLGGSSGFSKMCMKHPGWRIHWLQKVLELYPPVWAGCIFHISMLYSNI